MQKSLTRLFTAVLMAALLVSASIMSVSAAETPTCPDCDHTSHEGWIKLDANNPNADYYGVDANDNFTIYTSGKYYLDADFSTAQQFQIGTKSGDTVSNNGTAALNITATVCLNGHNLTGTTTLIRVGEYNTLNLVNCVPDDANETAAGVFTKGLITGKNYSLMLRGNATANIGPNVHLDNRAAGKFSTVSLQVNNGVLNMYGGTISNNEKNAEESGTGYDGIVNIASTGATFNMYGGKISGNTIASSGTVYNKGTFNMYGGEISGNTVTGKGGGVYSTGSVTMGGGTIAGNKATSNGGGICMADGTLTMSDGTISGNTGYNGGGIHADAGSVILNISGTAVIDGNTASKANNGGGGICLFSTSTLNLDGGSIINNVTTKTDNDTGGNGGAIMVGSSATAVINDVTISGNYAAGTANGVRQAGSTGSVTINDGGFADSVSLLNATITGGKFVSTSNSQADIEKYLETGYKVEAITGDDTYDLQVVDAVGDCPTHSGWTPIGSEADPSGYITEKGYYVLDVDLTAQSTAAATANSNHKGCLVIAAGKGTKVYICLNGHSIKAASDVDRAIRVYSGDVTLCNCVAKSDENPNSGLIQASGVSTIQVGTNSATLTNNNTRTVAQLTFGDNIHVDGGTASNAALHVGNDSTVVMKGGTVNNNKGTRAGAVWVQGGDFTITGGEIKNNTVIGGDAGAVSVNRQSKYAGIFTMKGGTIADNSKAEKGVYSGVYVRGALEDGVTYTSQFIMNGGTISGHNASNGGGVYMDEYSTFNMYDGEISGNTVTGMGGGVFMDNYSTFTLDGGTITGNTAAYGAGVQVGKSGGIGTSMVMKSGYITNNIGNGSSNGGGGICLFNSSTFTMDSGEITGNDAGTLNGGGIWGGANTIITINNGTISGNKAVSSTAVKGGASLTIVDGKFDGSVTMGTTNSLTGGKFSADTAWATLNAMLPADNTTLTVAEIEDGDYAYVVTENGFANTGAVMDHDSSLDFTLVLDTKAAEVNVDDFTVELVTDDDYTYVKGSEYGVMSITAKGIAAKEMHDDITFIVKDKDGNIWFKKTMSLYDAAEMMYNDENATELEKQVYADMIQYGNAAQAEWSYNTANMAALGTASTEVSGEWGATEGVGVSNEVYINDVAVSLSLKEKIQLNIYINDDKADVSGAESTVTGGLTKVTIDDIAVVDVKNKPAQLSVTMSDGGKFAVTYGINDYVLAAKNGDQADLIKALQMYVDSVINYMDSVNQNS